MTPLAQKLANQLTLPINKREIWFDSEMHIIAKSLSDVHCFEVSGIWESDGEQLPKASKFDKRNIFLPARDHTWFEFSAKCFSHRSAISAWHRDNNEIHFILFIEDNRDYLINAGWGRITTQDDGNFLIEGDEMTVNIADAILWTLSMINQPKFINQKQIMPHRGLEKKLINKFGVGKFPLRAFTEITLAVGVTFDMISTELQEAHFTGGRCKHWVRSFRRTVNGKEQLVRDHWRGDAALGIKQSRYRVILSAWEGEK